MTQKIYIALVNNKNIFNDGNVGREKERLMLAIYDCLHRSTLPDYQLYFTEKAYKKFNKQIQCYLKWCKSQGQFVQVIEKDLDISNLYLERYADKWKMELKFGNFA